MRKNISPTLIGVRAHPLVEHSAVNRVVVGSSPTGGVWKSLQTLVFAGFSYYIAIDFQNEDQSAF